MPADRHDPLLVPFAGYAHRRVLHVDVAETQIDEFGKAQTGRIQQLEHGTIAVDEWPVTGDFEQARHTVGVEVAGQAFF